MFCYRKKVCMETFVFTLEAIPSPALRKIAFAQVQVYGTDRQPVGPMTGCSTPRGRNWLCLSPISSAGFGAADSKAENPEMPVRWSAAGGRQAGSSLSNLQKRGTAKEGREEEIKI